MTEETTPRSAAVRSVVQAVIGVVFATLVFFLLPIPLVSLDRVFIVTVVFILGLVGAGVVIVRQVVNYRRAAEDGRIRFQGLLVAIYLTVLFFALSYYVLDRSHPGQIAGLETRVDALYLSLSTVSTVGFGDVHAAGQAGRAIVSLQMAFNLLFVSLALSAARAPVTRRREPS